MQLVVFRLYDEEYAVMIERVREIINYVPVTRLPGAPTYSEGIINIRGKIVPVADFAAKMGLPAKDQASRQIVIVETMGKEVGLTVDAVTEVIQTTAENFASVDPADAGSRSLRKVYKFHDRIIILLDIEQVLSGSEVAI
jgi:purine-binding chemotaxis protein CheW